jgi:hypothetical protein
MSEAGFPGFESGSWQGVFVPAGTPKDIVERLYASRASRPCRRARCASASPTAASSRDERLARGIRAFVADETAALGQGREGGGSDRRLMDLLNIAVIGLGWWGRVIVPLAKSSAKLRVVAVADPDPAAAEFARQHALPLRTMTKCCKIGKSRG